MVKRIPIIMKSEYLICSHFTSIPGLSGREQYVGQIIFKKI